MTCTLTDALDALIGTDVNFEIVKSQTVRPLKLNYVHNKVDVIRAFIFVQTGLIEFEAPYERKIRDEYFRIVGTKSAEEIADYVKQQLED